MRIYLTFYVLSMNVLEKNRTNYSTYTTVMKERINYFLGDDNYE